MADTEQQQQQPPQEAKTEETESQMVDHLTEGIVHLLQPVVQQCDMRTQLVLDSQHHLAMQIAKLSAELTKLQSTCDARSLAPPLQKLAAAKKKLANVGTIMGGVKDRVTNIEQLRRSLILLTPSTVRSMDLHDDDDDGEGNNINNNGNNNGNGGSNNLKNGGAEVLAATPPTKKEEEKEETKEEEEEQEKEKTEEEEAKSTEQQE